MVVLVVSVDVVFVRDDLLVEVCEVLTPSNDAVETEDGYGGLVGRDFAAAGATEVVCVVGVVAVGLGG